MKTKAQYKAANANYWVGCGDTVNKGALSGWGASEVPLCWVWGLLGSLLSFPVSPSLSGARWKGSSSVLDAGFQPTQYNSIQGGFMEHPLGTNHHDLHALLQSLLTAISGVSEQRECIFRVRHTWL